MRGTRRKLACVEDDIPANRVGVGGNGPGRFRRVAIRMHPDMAEVMAKACLHAGPRGSVQRLARRAQHAGDAGSGVGLARRNRSG
ncbi:hypothetical protein GCM10007387_05910 [Pseudoduganella albidiflava]|uniref:Uncharacterized protein n=1 Tax=Pseudoduganella albidiflava TaxID=321983 RepID=A0AA88BZ33_9BURK|nr:hypothetical protein GCM10007387_05910 [Pseudoduganella albidiflava]